MSPPQYQERLCHLSSHRGLGFSQAERNRQSLQERKGSRKITEEEHGLVCPVVGPYMGYSVLYGGGVHARQRKYIARYWESKENVLQVSGDKDACPEGVLHSKLA